VVLGAAVEVQLAEEVADVLEFEQAREEAVAEQ
jgi:hypothetical protein